MLIVLMTCALTVYCDHVVFMSRIIQDARARNPSLPPLPAPLPCGLVYGDEDLDEPQHQDRDNEESFADEISSSKKSRKSSAFRDLDLVRSWVIVVEGIRPWKALRKFCTRKLQGIFRLPSLPVWP